MCSETNYYKSVIWLQLEIFNFYQGNISAPYFIVCGSKAYFSLNAAVLLCCGFKQGIDGVEYLKIPMDVSTLVKFIEEEEAEDVK